LQEITKRSKTTGMMKKGKGIPAVLGIGNALVDVVNMLDDDSLLENFQLRRGSMTLVDSHLSQRIMEATQENKREITTGGSAANAIHALAALGASCGYIGKIGDDVLGAAFQKEFTDKKIVTHLLLSKKKTGRVMSLVSRDSERTMATYLGAAADLKPGDLSAEMFEGFSILFIEGYLVQDHNLIEKAIDIARSRGLKIALDLSSFNVVEANLQFLKKMIGKKVDIVFANEEEAMAFTGLQPEHAVSEIAGLCEIAVVKTGKTGSVIQSGSKFHIQGVISATAIDTTGAGDAYAAGFLYGLTKGYPLEQCAQIAALVSAKAVEVIGAKIPESLWPSILKMVDAITG
jgi:sugar/nucleoside kinase (ribokinase family)